MRWRLLLIWSLVLGRVGSPISSLACRCPISTRASAGTRACSDAPGPSRRPRDALGDGRARLALHRAERNAGGSGPHHPGCQPARRIPGARCARGHRARSGRDLLENGVRHVKIPDPDGNATPSPRRPTRHDRALDRAVRKRLPRRLGRPGSRRGLEERTPPRLQAPARGTRACRRLRLDIRTRTEGYYERFGASRSLRFRLTRGPLGLRATDSLAAR